MADQYSYYGILNRRAEAHKATRGILPAVSKNADGEITILTEGRGSDGQHFYRLMTMQHNGWIAINTYYEDGSTEETFER